MPRIATVHSAFECDNGSGSLRNSAAAAASGASTTLVESSGGEDKNGARQHHIPQYGDLRDPPRYGTVLPPPRVRNPTKERTILGGQIQGNLEPGTGGRSGSPILAPVGPAPAVDKRRGERRQPKEPSGDGKDAAVASSSAHPPWHSAAVEGWGEEVESYLRQVFPLFDLDQDGILDRADHALILTSAEEQGCARNAFLFHRFAGGSETITVDAFIDGVQAAWQLQQFRIGDLVQALRRGPAVRRPVLSRQQRAREKEKKGKEKVGKEKASASGKDEREGTEPAPNEGDGNDPPQKELDGRRAKPEEAPPGSEGSRQRKLPKPPPEIEERYRIGALLGKGGFAEVYRGLLKPEEGKEDGVKVEHALKAVEVREERGGLPRAMAVREAEIMLEANHKGIVKVFDCFHSDTSSHVWIAMELMQGGSLQSYVQENGKFEEKMAVGLFGQLLEAIDYLHNAMEVVHRDLKPDNVLLSSNGPGAADIVAKIGDFGLSTSYKSTRAMNLYCGTPQFAAPELVQGKGYSRAVDLWSAGVILFYMICGRRPFSGEKKELNQNICKAHYSFEKCEISPAAKDLISRLLKVEPLQRYSVKESLSHPWSNAETELAKGSLPLSVFEMLRIKTRTKSMLEAGLQSPEASPTASTSDGGSLAPDIFTTSQLLVQTELPERPVVRTELKLNRNNSYTAIPQARSPAAPAPPAMPGKAPRVAKVGFARIMP